MKRIYIVEYYDQNEERDFDWFIGGGDILDREKQARKFLEDQGMGEIGEIVGVYPISKDWIEEVYKSYKGTK